MSQFIEGKDYLAEGYEQLSDGKFVLRGDDNKFVDVVLPPSVAAEMGKKGGLRGTVQAQKNAKELIKALDAGDDEEAIRIAMQNVAVTASKDSAKSLDANKLILEAMGMLAKRTKPPLPGEVCPICKRKNVPQSPRLKLSPEASIAIEVIVLEEDVKKLKTALKKLDPSHSLLGAE